MEDQNNFREDALAGLCIRNLDLRGREIASFVVRNVRGDSSHAGPEALAIILEAVAKGLATEVEVLRGRRIR